MNYKLGMSTTNTTKFNNHELVESIFKLSTVQRNISKE